jgi:hypothetical protein
VQAENRHDPAVRIILGPHSGRATKNQKNSEKGPHVTRTLNSGLTGMRFSCAPLERGGHTSKGSQHDLSNVNEPAAQHGERPYAEWRQRQLQTLVRWPSALTRSQ